MVISKYLVSGKSLNIKVFAPKEKKKKNFMNRNNSNLTRKMQRYGSDIMNRSKSNKSNNNRNKIK